MIYRSANHYTIEHRYRDLKINFSTLKMLLTFERQKCCSNFSTFAVGVIWQYENILPFQNWNDFFRKRKHKLIVTFLCFLLFTCSCHRKLISYQTSNPHLRTYFCANQKEIIRKWRHATWRGDSQLQHCVQSPN